MVRQGSTLAVALALFGVIGSTAKADDLKDAWNARAESAEIKLKGPGLDACDKAYEHAFASSTERMAGTQRSFNLTFDIGTERMRAAYVYDGNRLSGFLIVALPPRWLTVQKMDGKTLSVLVQEAQCAFDLCTDDPFALGPCSGES